MGLAVFTILEASTLPYYTRIGPGPGFFPFWLGGLQALLSLAWLGQLCLRPAPPMSEDFIPARDGRVRVLTLLVSLVAYIGLIHPLGFRLTSLAFLLVLLRVLGRHGFLFTVALAISGSFGLYYLFQALDVYLPSATGGSPGSWTVSGGNWTRFKTYWPALPPRSRSKI